MAAFVEGFKLKNQLCLAAGELSINLYGLPILYLIGREKPLELIPFPVSGSEQVHGTINDRVDCGSSTSASRLWIFKILTWLISFSMLCH